MALDLADEKWPHKAQQILLRRDVLMVAAEEVERLIPDTAPVIDTGGKT